MSETKYGSEFGEDIADNSSNVSTVSTPDLRYLINDDYAPVGNTSNNYVMPGSYTGTGLTNTANFSDLTSLANTASKFLTDNKGLLTAGGAALGLLGGNNATSRPTGYQGGIPLLGASRTMLTAPPTEIDGVKRRPGSGGINYGGDVTYSRLAKDTDPWVNLDGTSGGVQGGTNAGSTAGSTAGGIKAAAPVNVGSLGYQNFIKSGGTPQGYLDTINAWLQANPNVTNAQLQAKMSELGVTATDLQTALGAGNYSAAEKYALSHGMGSAGVNDSINNFIAKYPNATAQQITDAMAQYGINKADVADALAVNKTASAADKWNIQNDKGLASVSSSINNYLALYPEATEKQKQDAMAQYGISAQDVAEAEALPEINKAAAIAAKQPVATEKQIMDAFTAGGDPSLISKMVASSGLSTADLADTFKLKQDDLAWLRGQGYLPPGYAEGGEIAMAKGRYLQGKTDGMADELPARIGRDQPAALSHGEFVIPADVVSHMGNGNSDAGAKKLYQMMDKIRMARTGTKKQGKKINPDKFMPGGLANSKYAKGGEVKKFQTGGTTGSALNAGLTGTESNLSNWAGPYVTGMLGQGQALANLPYQAYTGPLTAGASPLQTGAFSTAGGLTTPTSIGDAATTAGGIATKAQGLSYTPTTTSFDATQASAYMNPYIESALKPQLDEARRQSQITQQQNAAKMTQAGAFGGSRQAILDAETQRNLANTQAGITGTGYSTAYDKAMAQFNADQQRKMQEAQYGAGFGLQGLQTGLTGAQTQGQLGYQQNQAGLANLAAQLEAGAAERGIESEGIAADKAQFEEARANPYKMVQFQQSLLQGLPLAAQNYNVAAPSALTQAAQGATTVADLLDILSGKAPAKKV